MNEPEPQKKHVYNLPSYDESYILFKDLPEIKNKYKGLHFDSKKKKYYLKGRIVQLDILNFNKQVLKSYPLSNTIAFVDEKNYMEYWRAKRDYEKSEFITNIFFTDIEFITLKFDSFDWKK